MGHRERERERKGVRDRGWGERERVEGRQGEREDVDNKQRGARGRRHSQFCFFVPQKKQMSMPTHLELGLLPSSTKPSAIDSPFLTVPEEQPLPSRSPKVAGYEDERMNHSDDTLTGTCTP